ncbi:MAG: DegT/DnrJ/EryC1/StrS family aminotransferase, partial [Omnitrophica WOR_2 bacterium]
MVTTEALRQIPFVDLKTQYRSIAGEVNQAITNVLESTAFILGKEVSLFEGEFAAFCGAKYAVGVDSGTSALEMALRAYDIGPGDEVITQGNTFIATTLAISYTGATPVLVDIDPLTSMIDVSAIKKAITAKTKAIIPVHLFGHPADMNPIMAVAREHNLVVVEDACQGHGARYKGARVGAIGDIAAFSFYPGKNLGAYGDGGMIVTNNESVAGKIKVLRDVGQRQKYYHEVKGYNHRLDSLQAAILRVKLKYIDQWNEARRQNAAYYNDLFKDLDVVTPVTAEGCEPVFHLYVIRSDRRDALKHFLQERGIATGIHYPI